MEYYLRQAGRIDGPWSPRQIRALIGRNEWTPEADATEARGQTLSQLETATDWVPVATLLATEEDSTPSQPPPRRTAREILPKIFAAVGAGAMLVLVIVVNTTQPGIGGAGALAAAKTGFQAGVVGGALGYGIGYLIGLLMPKRTAEDKSDRRLHFAQLSIAPIALAALGLALRFLTRIARPRPPDIIGFLELPGSTTTHVAFIGAGVDQFALRRAFPRRS